MPHAKSISSVTLKSWLEEGRDVIVLDVLPPEHHAARHIPESRNHCVYEMTFLDQITQAGIDPGAAIVVSSSSHRCLGAQDAADKLLAAGYADVTICQDGIEGWVQAGYPVAGHLGDEPASPCDLGVAEGVLHADPQASRIQWTGRNRNGFHTGTVNLSQGSLRFTEGRLARGTFTLDMRSLKDDDLEDASLAALLVAHLYSGDFFLVDAHPEALFETTRVVRLPGHTAGSANYEVEGQLTLRGVTRDLGFPATVERLDDGLLSLEAHFDLDRTRWGARYGSGRFFEKLGMHLVHDLVSIQLRLVTAHTFS